jgi:hypothetical protein
VTEGYGKRTHQTIGMIGNIQITHGGDKKSGDFSLIKKCAKAMKPTSWACLKETKKGAGLLIYFGKPRSAIMASAVACKDAIPRRGKWPYETKIDEIKILPVPISLNEMREMFPRWKWLNNTRSKQFLDNDKANLLSKRSSRKLKTPPVSVKVSGAGFGKPEQNRLVEQAACKAVRKHFERQGYEVVSREKENEGYDFDVTRNGMAIHVEVKGVSGSLQKFQITANEVACAHTDSKFQLALVTNALSPKQQLKIFSRKDFLKSFSLKPLAYFAELNLPA